MASAATQSRAHIEETPNYLLYLRIPQAVLALVILALVSFALSVFHATYFTNAYGLNIFTCILSFVVIAYSTLPARVAPQAYNMLACLAMEMVIIIFWLASFSIMADYSAGWGYGTFDYVYGYNYYGWKRDAVIVKRSDKYYAAWQSGAAAAGLGGLEFLLFIATLVIHAMAVQKHRNAARQNVAGAGGQAYQPSPMAQQQQQQGEYIQQPPQQPYMQPNTYQQHPSADPISPQISGMQPSVTAPTKGAFGGAREVHEAGVPEKGEEARLGEVHEAPTTQ